MQTTKSGNLSVNFSNFETSILASSAILFAAALALSACDGGSASGSGITTLAPVASGANTPTAQTSYAGAVDIVEKLVVLEVQETIPGRLDYKLAAIVCNGQQTKNSQKVTVKYADPAATVLNSETHIGASHYGQCRFNTRSPFEVRIDKAAGFDPAKVAIEIQETKPLPTNPIRLIKVDMYQAGGRAGHEALLALNTAYPKSGQTVNLRAIVDGKQVTASYKVLTPSGGTLQEAKDFSIPSTTEKAGVFAAEFVVPSTPFRVQISAKDSYSNSLTWTTEVYEPQPSLLRINFENAVFTAPNTSRTGSINGTAARSGNLMVRLHLPAGLQTDWDQKTVAVTSGQAIELPFKLTAPDQLQIGKHRVFVQYKYEQDADVLVRAPILITKTLN